MSRDPKVQKDLLKLIWFTMYSRGGGKVGSSAFEHVFLGELKRGEISGLHNWIFFANEEGQKNADYLGYIRKLELGGVSNIFCIIILNSLESAHYNLESVHNFQTLEIL